MTYSEALDYIHSFRPFVPSTGLERVRPLLQRLGDPQDKLRFVHVAGTNGKGSTVAMCANILKEAGYRCGMYTSPYVLDFCERFQVNGAMISHPDLARITGQIMPVLEQMKEEKLFVTEFDVVTAIAFLYFLEKQCDIVCLEVGLGGRFDSTNIIHTPLAAVITSISLDHTHILGDTVEKIAREKAGIIKPGGDCVCYPKQSPDALAVLMEQCALTGSRLIKANPANIQIHRADLQGAEFSYQGKDYQITLVGEHQIYNAVAVLDTVRLLQTKGFLIPESAIQTGLKNTAFSARFQKLGEHPLVYVDGAHNLEGAQGLAHTLEQFFGKKVLLIGMMADKDYEHALGAVCRPADAVICVPVNHPRALGEEQLKQSASHYCGQVYAIHDLRKAYATARSLAGAEGMVVVCGSFFLAGEMLPIVNTGQI